MSLSNCPECWDTPCMCGEYWKDWSNDKLAEYIVSVVAKKSRQDGIIILDYAKTLKYEEPIE